MASRKSSDVPQFVKGRKGQTSVVDCIVRALWRDVDGHWPERTFEQLREAVSKMQGYTVVPSTIRSSIYQYPTIFERVNADGGGTLYWRLTKQARVGQKT
jgi:hypothetical protein